MEKFYFATALAAFALASCTSDDIGFNTAQDVIEAQQSNAIQFGTYMGKQAVTRAGMTGNIDNLALRDRKADNSAAEDRTFGFGVFAYYTPQDASSHYTYWNSITASDNTTNLTTNYTSASKANFMFNQQVHWTAGTYTGYVGANTSGDSMWVYTPLKYWPNDFSETDVDDQPDDTNTAPAKGSDTQGIGKGHVSFFAYAPYVDFSNTTTYGIAATGGTDYGIVAINGETTLESANTKSQDPILTYKLNNNKAVDLLWGTADNTSENVNGTAQTGAYTGYTPSTGSKHPSKYPVNINLTKQKTTGTVNFAFKHALARVGGSTITPGTAANPNGLLVVLDIDDQKGAETGGIKGTTTNIDNNTKVTIKSITISQKKISVDENEDGAADGTQYRVTGGTFNLATGQWTLTKDNEETAIIHTITEASNTTNQDAVLVKDIAEPSTPPVSSSAADFFNASNSYNGVTGVPQTAINVYGTETNPFLFIPNTFPEFDITVDYIVRTKDTNLDGGFSQVENIITKHVTFTKPVEMNKQYSILMHLSLTSVKFTATVSNWDSDYTDLDNDGQMDANEIEITDVFVPVNVGDAATSMTVKAGSGTSGAEITNNATTAAHTHIINLYGLKAGNTVSVSSLTGNNDGSASVSYGGSATSVTTSGTATVRVPMKEATTTQNTAVTITESGTSGSVTYIKLVQTVAP